MEWFKHSNIDPSDTELFNLETYPCLDADLALPYLNHNEALLKMMLQDFFLQEMPIEKHKLNAAFAIQDWESIEKLTHKIMGGITYLGLTKMLHACQNFERYFNSGNTQLLAALYEQLMECFAETQDTIQDWLGTEAPTDNQENTEV